MNCIFCGKKMWLDDWDRCTYNKYNFDRYWLCDDCNASCIETVVCNITVEERWHREDKEGNILFNQTISKL